MNIIIQNYLLLYKGYKLKCSIGKSGIKLKKKEGDLATPKGIFKLGFLYYRKDRNKKINCILKKKIIEKSMGWCDDVRSDKYNQEVNFPYKYTAEHLYRKDRIYDIFINIKYNCRPVKKGKGSAIFLHLTNKRFNPTKGCIAILRKDFLKILPLINQKTKIVIK